MYHLFTSRSIKKSILFSLVFIFLSSQAQDEYSAADFLKLRFGEASTVGIFVALAFPIDLPGREVYYSHFFEAIHLLPTGDDSFGEYPPIISRDMDRRLIYNVFEKKINANGYAGKPCLLRLICEVAHTSVGESNGVLGDILHIIFTPTSTINFELPSEYEEAEVKGKNHDCLDYNQNCTISFLDLISLVEYNF